MSVILSFADNKTQTLRRGDLARRFGLFRTLFELYPKTRTSLEVPVEVLTFERFRKVYRAATRIATPYARVCDGDVIVGERAILEYLQYVGFTPETCGKKNRGECLAIRGACGDLPRETAAVMLDDRREISALCREWDAQGRPDELSTKLENAAILALECGMYDVYRVMQGWNVPAENIPISMLVVPECPLDIVCTFYEAYSGNAHRHIAEALLIAACRNGRRDILEAICDESYAPTLTFIRGILIRPNQDAFIWLVNNTNILQTICDLYARQISVAELNTVRQSNLICTLLDMCNAAEAALEPNALCLLGWIRRADESAPIYPIGTIRRLASEFPQARVNRVIEMYLNEPRDVREIYQHAADDDSDAHFDAESTVPYEFAEPVSLSTPQNGLDEPTDEPTDEFADELEAAPFAAPEFTDESADASGHF